MKIQVIKKASKKITPSRCNLVRRRAPRTSQVGSFDACALWLSGQIADNDVRGSEGGSRNLARIDFRLAFQHRRISYPRRTLFRRWVMVCLLFALLISQACSAPATIQRLPDTLRIGAGASPGSEVINVLTDYLFSEPLLFTDWHGRTVSRLASGWQWEDDGLTLRIQVRPGVKMHDGRPVDAALVVGHPALESRGVARLRVRQVRRT